MTDQPAPTTFEAADAVHAMVHGLQAAGASVELEPIAGLAHAYPALEMRHEAVEMLVRAGSGHGGSS